MMEKCSSVDNLPFSDVVTTTGFFFFEESLAYLFNYLLHNFNVMFSKNLLENFSCMEFGKGQNTLKFVYNCLYVMFWHM